MHNPNNPCLYITSDGECGDYVALSYVWGGDQPFKTTRSNFAQYCKGIPASKLPQTITDAIRVAHQLDIKYLWIDALCIIQDYADDIAVEIQNMANIYKNALVTIAAASAERCTDGFLEERLPKTLEFSCPFALPGDGTIVEVTISDPDGGRWREPLWERAWTLQEMMLSRRVLIYGAKGLYWKCQESFFSDGGEMDWDGYCYGASISTTLSPRSLPMTEKTDSQVTEDTMRARWLSVIKDFTSRKITAPTDKLPAISAIAREMGTGQGGFGDYLAGLWRNHLLDDLMWRVSRQQKLSSDAMPYRAPSWSWASPNGTIEYEDPEAPMYDHQTEQRYNMYRRHVATVVECETFSTSADSYGQISGGKLRIQGKVKRAGITFLTGLVASIVRDAVVASSNHSENGDEDDEDDETPYASVDLDGPKAFSTDYHQPSARQLMGTTGSVTCLIMQYRGRKADQAFAQGLVLAEARTSDGAVVYHRLGIFECMDVDESAFFDDAESQIVTLI